MSGWLSQLSMQLRLRSWSHGSWVQAPHWALCWQLRAWSLLWSLCLCSLPLPRSFCLSVSLSQKSINIKKNKIHFSKPLYLLCSLPRTFSHALLPIPPPLSPLMPPILHVTHLTDHSWSFTSGVSPLSVFPCHTLPKFIRSHSPLWFIIDSSTVSFTPKT